MKKITAILLVLGCLFFAGECFAVEETGPVVDVLDGDTLTIKTREGKLLRIRLREVDAPEVSQTFGRQARQFAWGLLTGKSVRVKYKTLDRYGRAIGEVILADGRILNRELLSHGLLEVFQREFQTSACRHLKHRPPCRSLQPQNIPRR